MTVKQSFRITLFLFSFQAAAVCAEDWTEFRGPTGQGHSSVRRLPLTWSDESENIEWKVPIEGLGWSSPVVRGDQVWLTTATEEGLSFRAVCRNVMSGFEIHNVEVFHRQEGLRIHGKNSHASPTPILVGDRVFVHYGTYGTACLSADDGKIIWSTSIDYRHVHGPGGSPVVYEDLLIFSCDGGEQPFVIALDTETGEEKWRTARPKNDYFKKFAFSTPLVIEVDGEPQLASAGAGSVVAYQPRTGKQLWYVNYPKGYSVVPRPVFSDGLLFVSSSFDRSRLLAIRPGGMDDVTETNVAWMFDRGAPHSPSPLVVGNEVYVVSDRGVATCLDTKTGEEHWQQRLGGNYSASPLFAAGRIYFLDEKGTTTVIEPDNGECKELAKNTITGRTLASLSPVEGAMLLRTDTHLYRIAAD